MQQTLSLLSRYQCCLETSAGLAEDELVVRMLITVPIKNFHSYGDVIAFGKRLQLGAHSHRPVRLFFLACYTFCGTGSCDIHTFYSRKWNFHYTCLKRSVVRGIRNPTFYMPDERSTNYATAVVSWYGRWCQKVSCSAFRWVLSMKLISAWVWYGFFLTCESPTSTAINWQWQVFRCSQKVVRV